MKIKTKITEKFLKSREDRIKLLGEDHAKEIEKRIFLQSIDLNWKSHIQYLEQLKTSNWTEIVRPARSFG
jgi:preprotein translocase subunit SecA